LLSLTNSHFHVLQAVQDTCGHQPQCSTQTEAPSGYEQAVLAWANTSNEASAAATAPHAVRDDS